MAIPVAALADAPTTTDKQNAATQCKALLKAEGTSNFTHAWGAKGKGKAYGKCVSSKAKEEAAERTAAKSNAAKQCKAEQAMTDDQFKADTAHSGKSFAEFYGAKNASSAYGKCVSTKAKQNKEAADQKDQDTISAAKFCKGEQSKAEFKTTYTSFGACVSKKAHELTATRQQQRSATAA
jgi:roadblock/LC7 domain-containing protein